MLPIKVGKRALCQHRSGEIKLGPKFQAMETQITP